jgi:hypothetical protein
MKGGRFDLHGYKTVEYNSLGFSAAQITAFLKDKGVKVRVRYVFALPIEISAKILCKSRVLFRVLTLFGEAVSHIPFVNSQFGALLVIVRRFSN